MSILVDFGHFNVPTLKICSDSSEREGEPETGGDESKLCELHDGGRFSFSMCMERNVIVIMFFILASGELFVLKRFTLRASEIYEALFC